MFVNYQNYRKSQNKKKITKQVLENNFIYTDIRGLKKRHTTWQSD